VYRPLGLDSVNGQSSAWPKLAAAIGTTLKSVGNHLVDGLGRKVGSQVLLMAGLPAPLAILAVLSRRLGRFNQITGRRLGRVRGVLFRLRQFRLQRGDPLQQRCGGPGHRRLNHRVNLFSREDYSRHASFDNQTTLILQYQFFTP
jgi:hypothetical protein